MARLTWVAMILLLCTGALLAQPQIIVQPEAIDFGEVTVGTTARTDVMILNASMETLVLNAAVFGDAFSLLGPPQFVLEPRDTAFFLGVGFAPMEIGGSYTGELQIQENNPGGPAVTVSLSGTGGDGEVPPNFDLVAPANWSYIEEGPVVLEWSALNVPEEVTYTAYVMALRNDSTPAEPMVYDAGAATTFAIPEADLVWGNMYTWWVVAHRGEDDIASNSTWTFFLYIAPPPAPHFSLLAPEDNSAITENTVDFRWEDVGTPIEPAHYTLSIVTRDSINGGGFYSYDAGSNTTYTVDISGFENNIDYVWYVVAETESWGWLSSDQVWRFHLAMGVHDDVDLPGSAPLPDRLRIESIYPNPFNPVTEIRFALPHDGAVRAEIFDVLGRNVATLVDGYLPAGEHQFTWQAAGPSGMYLLRISDNRGGADIRKLAVMK